MKKLEFQRVKLVVPHCIEKLQKSVSQTGAKCLFDLISKEYRLELTENLFRFGKKNKRAKCKTRNSIG